MSYFRRVDLSETYSLFLFGTTFIVIGILISSLINYSQLYRLSKENYFYGKEVEHQKKAIERQNGIMLFQKKLIELLIEEEQEKAKKEKGEIPKA